MAGPGHSSIDRAAGWGSRPDPVGSLGQLDTNKCLSTDDQGPLGAACSPEQEVYGTTWWVQGILPSLLITAPMGPPHPTGRAGHTSFFFRGNIRFRGLAKLALGHTDGTGAQDLQPEVRVHFFLSAGGQIYLFSPVSLLFEDLEAVKGREGAGPSGFWRASQKGGHTSLPATAGAGRAGTFSEQRCV